MTRQTEGNTIETVIELLIENGFPSFADVLRILLNEAMKIERDHALGAARYEPSEARKGCRSERALTTAAAGTYVKGHSTRMVNDVLEKLCGLHLNCGQVSRVAGLLHEEINRRSRKEFTEKMLRNPSCFQQAGSSHLPTNQFSGKM